MFIVDKEMSMSPSEETIVFDRLLNQLCSIYADVARKRSVCENVSKDCRTLFKPWPKKRSATEEDESSKETKSAETTADAEQPAVSVQELEQLSLVDRALARAQRTRKMYKNKVESEVEHGKKNPPKTNVAVWSQKPGVDRDGQPKPKPGTRASESSSLQLHPKQPVDTAVIPSAVLQEVNADTATRSSRTGKSTASVKKPMARYKPAHHSAPFKTVQLPPGQSKLPPISRPGSRKASASWLRTSRVVEGRRIDSHGVQVGVTTSAASQKAETRGIVHGVGRTSITSSIDGLLSSSGGNFSVTGGISSDDVTSCVETDPSQQLMTPHDDWSRDTVSAVIGQQNKFLADDVSSNSEAVVQSAVATQQKVNRSCSQQNAAEESASSEFILQRHGHQLKLPTSLRKSMSMNRKLRDKVRQAYSTSRHAKLRDGESSAEQFVTRLNAVNTGGTSEADMQLYDNVNLCCDVYDWLRRLLTIVMDTARHVDVLPWQRVIRNKMVLEYILVEFANMEDIFQSLCKKLPAPLTRKSSVERCSRNACTVDFPSKWLPSQFDREFPQLSRVLHYRSTSQLIKYTALLHQVQLLMLHRQMLLDIGQTAVSLLHHMNPADSRCSHAYRLTYSLLKTFGQHFPTIVSDTAPDETSNETPPNSES